MIDLTVAIVSFNTCDVLAGTIEGVLADSGSLAMEVIVVDNASRDGSAAMVRERFPRVRLIENRTNRFYSAANNQAIAAGRGRYLLVLNSDARPEPGTLKAMVSFMDANPRAGALSPRMRFPDGRLQRNCARAWSYDLLLYEYTPVGLFRPQARRRARASYWYADWDRTTAREVEVIPGSCMLVRRDAIARTGGFDERLVMYFSEDEWCTRIRAAGYTIVYAPIGDMVHAEGVSTASVRRLARRLYYEDMVTYARLRWGPARAQRLRACAAPMRLAQDIASVLRCA